jgi:formylglycine-generating enzyme required for sulfatase activity
MTELEFEKACRGGSPTSNVLYGEYAWGTASITMATSIVNDGLPTEKAGQTGNDTSGLCCFNNGSNIQGPLRSGFAATATSGTTNRVPSGASYYGVMDLSGNDYERCVTVGNPTGRLFDGAHGDGTLATDGNAYGTSLQYWPGYTTSTYVNEISINTAPVGSGYRGGYWDSVSLYVRTSARYYAAYVNAIRFIYNGIRCVRTSPSS